MKDKNTTYEVTEEIRAKENQLKEYIREQGVLAIAFSGGVDSTYLLHVAHEVLGDNVLAVTAKASAFSERDLAEAKAFCEKEGISHEIVEIDELAIPGFVENPPDRCYICKKGIFGELMRIAALHDIHCVAEGSNMSDLGDYRPGLKAIEEMGVKSPLRESGLYKNEIRALSEVRNLPTWSKPSAACLASRFVYGETITREKLGMVERAENILSDMGFRQLRVRMHGETLARIEVEEPQLAELLRRRQEILTAFREIGYTYVTMDLKGYRTGSMNEAL
jgi:pyridinium-3,5-biscarboxylic acid mononucleotide sulfurtransferase